MDDTFSPSLDLTSGRKLGCAGLAFRRTSRSLPFLTALVLGAVSLPEEASAWGAHGHAVICEMAYDQLSEKARTEVDRLMAVHPDDERLATACAWADRQPRKKPRQHYVNFPRDQAEVTRQDCGEADRCIFTALRDDALAMRDVGRSDPERAEAMILLGHWIGDIHQPMHVGFADDRGGNSIHVKRGPKQGRAGKPCTVGSYNLHSVWDSCVVETDAPTKRGTFGLGQTLDVGAHADLIATRFGATERAGWQQSEVVDWAQESLNIARDAPVQYCTLNRDTGFCAYSPTQDYYFRDEDARYDGARSMAVTHGYVSFAQPIAEERLAMAAARFAAELEAAFGDEP